MKVVLNILIAGSCFVIAYVLVNGVELDYSLFGWRVLSGWLVVLAALSILFGSVSARFARVPRVEGTRAGLAVRPRPRPTGAAVLFFIVAGVIIFVGGQSTTSLAVGDCFDMPSETQVSTVPTISCGEPHDSEVYVVTSVPASVGPGYPGRERLSGMAIGLCLPGFEDYVGASYEDSILDVIYFFPPPSAWADDDRSVTCGLFRLDGRQMIGSVKGSGL